MDLRTALERVVQYRHRLYARRIGRCPRDGGRGRCAERQRNRIVRFIRQEACKGYAIQENILQRHVRQCGYRERECIGLLRLAVSGGHFDLCRTRRRGSLRDDIGGRSVLRRCRYYRRRCRAVRQSYIITRQVRVEAAYRLAVHLDVRQTRVVRRLRDELDPIGRGRRAVLRGDRHQRRRAVHLTVRDPALGVRQTATLESSTTASRVRQHTGSANGRHLRDRCRAYAQRIDLLARVVRVKTLPFTTAYIDLLRLARVDELDIIHLHRATRVLTAVRAEIRIATCGQDHVTFGRHVIAHVIDRDHDTRPVVITPLLIEPSLGDLLRELFRSAFVAVQRLTDIRLLIYAVVRITRVRYIRTRQVLRLVGLAFGRTGPCVVEQVEILIRDMIARSLIYAAVVVTLDPNHHRVRTITPVDTAVRTGRGVIDGRQVGQIRPWVTQRHVPRRSGTDRSETHKLVLDLQRRTACSTGGLMCEVLIHTQLGYIGEIPMFRLLLTVKLRTRPILKTRVRELLCHYRHTTD